MIVPMKKVSLVVLKDERKSALKELRKLGVLHVEEVTGGSEELTLYKDQTSKVQNALAVLNEIKTGKKDTPVQVSLSRDKVYETAKNVLTLCEEKKSCFERITNNTAEISRFDKWGTDIDPQDFDYLKSKNINISLYEIPADKYKLIGEDVDTVFVNKDKNSVRFFVVTNVGETDKVSGLPPEAFNVTLPRLSLSSLRNEIDDYKKRIVQIDGEIKSCVQYRDALKASLTDIAKDMELENLYSGMGYEGKVVSDGSEAKNETEQCCKDCSVELAWLTGYVPEDEMSVFEKGAKSHQWAYIAQAPGDEDNVPTKLKNNKFVSLIYPLTDFLGTVPGYHEYDISGWFLLFFTVFFGMIFGDGGYGALVTAFTLIFVLKSVFTGKKVAPVLNLVLLLGVATMVWGAVTCTWFGLLPEQLPQWIVGLSVAPLSNACTDQWLPFWTNDPSSGTLTTANNLQIFCFTLALLQLCVAHLKGIARFITDKDYRLKAIGEFGSFIELVGMYWIVLSMVVNDKVFPMIGGDVYGLPWGTISVGMVGAGFALSFVFSNYEGSVVKSVLESVKNIISVLLGVVNVFSDIVSYIRLWAVGLAGAAISNTVNTMAGPLAGRAVLFGAFVLLLVFGHGLNMILNLLSVIVHGVRLNTLEFSNHLGMSWSGFKYEPFRD